MKIKISFFGILMIFVLIVTHSYVSLAALAAAFLHELGHILAARICNIPLRELKLDIFGAAITPKGQICSYKKEILFAAAGPAVNLLTVACLMPYTGRAGQLLQLFTAASAFLGILNLLPIQSFDGARILSCALSLRLSPRAVSVVSSVISCMLAFSLWLLSVYLLLRRGATLSLFVFSFALLCKMCSGGKGDLEENMQD